MKHKITKLICLILSAFMILGATACGETGDPTNDRIEIKIYAGGSSQYQWKKGTKEDEVLRLIEQKYEQEEGVKLTFNVQFYGHDMWDSVGTAEDLDIIISHVGGGVGVDDKMIDQEIYYDLSDDLTEDTGYDDIIKHTKMTFGEGADAFTLDAMDRVTTHTGDIIGIPSVISPYRYGILVRKDLMEKYGYTDDANDTSKILVNNYADFEQMCIAIRNGENMNFAVSGAIYEVEATGLVGACGLDAGFWTMTNYVDGNGTELTNHVGYMNPDYAKVVEIESRWIKNGVLAKDPSTIKVDDCEGHFISGATAVFLQNGSIDHLIEMARACKSLNSQAEFTVLSGLTLDRTSTAKGVERKPLAAFMAGIKKDSKDIDEILSFLDWVYDNEDNYNLCRYGVEGTHWIDNENGTYSYPAGSNYSVHNKPYSGILTLVENQVISNLRYAGTTADEQAWFELEQKWYETVENTDNYVQNPVVDYLLKLPQSEQSKHYTKASSISSGFLEKVWGYVEGYQDFTVDGPLGDEYRRLVNEYLASTAYEYCVALNQRYKLLAGITD